MNALIGILIAFFIGFVIYFYREDSSSYQAHERDLVIRTLWAEAGKEPRQGQIFALWVMRNRVGCYGWDSLTKVVKAKNQFEPWVYQKTRAKMQVFSDHHALYQKWLTQNKNGRRRVSFPFADMRKVRADWQSYRRLARLYDKVMRADKKADPTGNAFYFENRAITKKRGRGSLCRGRKVKTVGQHSFCQAEQIVKRKKCKMKVKKRGKTDA